MKINMWCILKVAHKDQEFYPLREGAKTFTKKRNALKYWRAEQLSNSTHVLREGAPSSLMERDDLSPTGFVWIK